MTKKIFFSLILSVVVAASSRAAETTDSVFTLINDLFLPSDDAPEIPDTLAIDTTLNVNDMKLPSRMFGVLVYDKFKYETDSIIVGKPSATSHFNWINRQKRLSDYVIHLRQRTMFANPDIVPYNVALLPDPPKEYHAKVDPKKATIVIEEEPVKKESVKDAPKPVKIDHINWLNDFTTSLHFSQAYNSPNWYQGGNNNLNIICQAAHTIKLNQAFHPNIMFENSIQYKLALNSAPEDSLRNYSIAEDIFQINTKFGLRAAKDWYYSVTMLFKTQMMTNYKKNTNDVKAAFLSPGELNIGFGMSYSRTNPKKTVTFDTSISPISYNLKICTDDRLNKADFGIEQDKNTASEIGSNAEAKLKWKMAYNITYTSRLYAFTDYSYVQGDWEHTLSFEVNRYLSTQIYAHLRYDSSTPRLEDSKWHTWQLKEILSFGLTYKFATI
ncbi:MAG: DUF3078 domain-containing protein [Muribaculaceae bacterium]